MDHWVVTKYWSSLEEHTQSCEGCRHQSATFSRFSRPYLCSLNPPCKHCVLHSCSSLPGSRAFFRPTRSHIVPLLGAPLVPVSCRRATALFWCEARPPRCACHRFIPCQEINLRVCSSNKFIQQPALGEALSLSPSSDNFLLSVLCFVWSLGFSPSRRILGSGVASCLSNTTRKHFLLFQTYWMWLSICRT